MKKQIRNTLAVALSLLFVFTGGFSRRAVRNFRLRGLDPDADYRAVPLFEAESVETILKGEELMKYGVRTVFPENEHIRHQAGLSRISEI